MSLLNMAEGFAGPQVLCCSLYLSVSNHQQSRKTARVEGPHVVPPRTVSESREGPPERDKG